MLGEKKNIAFICCSVPIIAMLMLTLVSPAFASTEWYVRRPSTDIVYHQTIGNSYSNGIATCGIGVEIIEFQDSSETFQGKDFLSFRVVTAANTRTGITYTVTPGGLSFWYGSSTPTGITGDDQSKQFNLPNPFRFFGIVYDKVWVCSNGFLSFDSSSTSWSPKSIPNSASPNTLIAGFWRDLNPAKGGSITYFSGHDSWGLHIFAVTWNSVPNYANNNRQTFQIILRENRLNYEDDVIFSYDTITKDVFTVVGIEDQTGLKGTSYNYNNLGNYKGLTFQCGILPKTIDYLTIKFQKIPDYSLDPCSAVNIQDSEIGGYNIRLKDTSNPWANVATDIFVLGVKQVAPLLINAVIPGSGIVVKGILIGAEIAHILSRDLSPVLPVGTDPCDWWEMQGYVKAAGALEDPNEWYLYDSTLGCTFIWVFSDLGNVDHTLKIWAELQYFDWASGTVTISSNPVYISVLRNTVGDPCPTLFAWNGQEYVNEGVLNIHSSSDITVQQVIPKEDLVPEDHKYVVSLRELDNYTSHIDYIKLYAVDTGGKMHECYITEAEHSRLGNIKHELLRDDSKRVDLYPLETIIAKFAARYVDEIAYFVFEINGVNYK